MPARGCTTTPARLVDDEQVLVLVGDPERRGRVSAAGGGRLSVSSTTTCSPARRGGAWAPTRRRRSPARRRSAAARGCASRAGPRGARRAASPRSGGTRSSIATLRRTGVSTPARGAGVALDDEQQETTPSVIAASARLNAGQSGSLTKSVTEPRRARSIDVADGAAEQQPGRQPDQRPSGAARSRRAGRPARRRRRARRAPGCRQGPKATPSLRDVDELERRADEVACPRPRRCCRARAPWSWSTATTSERRQRRAAPGPRARIASPVDQVDDDAADDVQRDHRDDRAEVDGPSGGITAGRTHRQGSQTWRRKSSTAFERAVYGGRPPNEKNS